MTRHLLHYILIMVAIFLLIAGSSSQVLAQAPDGVTINNPQSGETISGLIILTGIVDFPDFNKYEVLLKMGDRLIWAATGYSPVINGNLARLDTRTFINGTYQLVIRKVGADSQYTDYLGPSFTISNPQGAPNPYPEVESSYLYPAEGKALVRVRNCTGEDFEFDYGSPTGFKDAGHISLPPKPNEAICPYADLALKPAEYRGTGKGGAQSKAITYSFMAEAGKVYQIIYNGPGAGANEVYIGPIEGDERASSDTGGLLLNDPARLATPMAVSGAEPAVDTVTVAPTPIPTIALAMPAPSTSEEEAPTANNQSMLPISGQAAPSKVPFVIAAGGLILFLMIGGVVAARKRSYTP